MPRYAVAPALFIFSLSAALAQEQTADAGLLEQLLGGINTLSADVTQLIIESDGGVLEESLIRMYLLRPNGFYWETLEPFPELLVTNGEILWNYQPDLEQVIIEDFSGDESELAAQLLSGNTDALNRDYLIANVSSDTEFLGFELVPVASDSVYSRIDIHFLAEEIESIHIANKNGEQTVWRFSAVQRNRGLADELFRFEIPADIEVIDNSSGA